MLTETNLQQIQALVQQHGGNKATELGDALLDLQKTIVGQSLLIRALLMDLENRQVGDAALEGLLNERSLSVIYQKLGSPKQNPFSVSDANAAIETLANKVSGATNFADIAKTLVAVAKVFI